jgi:hypothetical protein
MKKQLIAVRLKASDVEILKKVAAAHEETVSEVIRTLVENMTARYRKDMAKGEK